MTAYPPECRYCIEHARKLQEEHAQEIKRLRDENEALKTKLGCQEVFIDKLLLLIKPTPIRKGLTPIMEGLKMSPPPLKTSPATAQTKIMTDSPYHQ